MDIFTIQIPKGISSKEELPNENAERGGCTVAGPMPAKLLVLQNGQGARCRKRFQNLVCAVYGDYRNAQANRSLSHK